MPVINAKEIPGYLAPKPNEREMRAVLAPELGNYDKATVALVQFPPGGSTGLHKHDYSDEVIYIASGEGEAIEIVEDKEIITRIKPGCVIVIKAGTPHLVKNTSSAILEAFCLFIPPISPPTGILAEAINKAKEHFKAKHFIK